MFILKDIDDQSRIAEADEETKPSCEVHGGNLFVKLHFKAQKDLPDTIELINTVVTSKEESSAKFSGCGKHLVAVKSADEESPIKREDALKYIKQYLGVMFGQDVGNQIGIDDVATILANGEVATPEELKKWEEQQKEKEKGGGEEEKESVDESIPSFGKFMLGEEDEAAGDGEEDENVEDDDEAEAAGGDEDGDAGGDEDDQDGGGDEDDDEAGGDGDEAEEAGEEVPDPATFMIHYLIKADGLPEEDHTDPKAVEKITGGKLILPGSKFNLGIEFKSGGATVDTIDLKKLGKELKGNVDADELDDMLGKIFSKNFPQVQTISRGVRDARTITDEIKTMNFQEDDQYVRDAMQKIGKSAYSFYLQLKDNPAKPYVNKKDIVDMVNASLKQMNGRWLKFMSGIGEKDVIELHATTQIGANTKADRDAVFRSVPEPEQVQNIIDGPGQKFKDPAKFDAPKIWSDLAKVFKSLRDKNQKYDDHTIKKIIEIWVNFQKSHNNRPDDVEYRDFDGFYRNYKSAYDSLGIRDRLDESFLSERALMEELFGKMYEDDDPDEHPDGDTPAAPEPAEPEAEEDSDDDSDDDSSGGSGGGDGGDDDESKFQVKIFVLPMPHLNKAFSKDNY